MTYNPEATRSKLVEGIPFLFFLSFSSSPVTCQKTSPVTCHIHHRRSHVTIHPRSHVTNIPWSHVTNIPGHMSHSSEAHQRLIPGHMSHSSGAHPRLILGSSRCRSHVTITPGGRSHVKFIDYSRYATLRYATLFFSIKNLSFIPFFTVIIRSLSSFGHISLSHSIHLD